MWKVLFLNWKKEAYEFMKIVLWSNFFFLIFYVCEAQSFSIHNESRIIKKKNIWIAMPLFQNVSTFLAFYLNNNFYLIIFNAQFIILFISSHSNIAKQQNLSSMVRIYYFVCINYFSLTMENSNAKNYKIKKFFVILLNYA